MLHMCAAAVVVVVCAYNTNSQWKAHIWRYSLHSVWLPFVSRGEINSSLQIFFTRQTKFIIINMVSLGTRNFLLGEYHF